MTCCTAQLHDGVSSWMMSFMASLQCSIHDDDIRKAYHGRCYIASKHGANLLSVAVPIGDTTDRGNRQSCERREVTTGYGLQHEEEEHSTLAGSAPSLSSSVLSSMNLKAIHVERASGETLMSFRRT